MDCAKALGACLAYPKKSLNQLKGVLKVLRKIPMLIAIPTTAGTGSEVTLAAVITDSEKQHKYTLMDFTLIPRYAVLDPSVTFSLPPSLTATTGMDALTHAVEAYIGRATTRYTRTMAVGAIRLIFENLYLCYQNGTDFEARKNMLKASFMAGNAFTRSYVAGASLYLRPTLIGTNPQLGVQSSKESTFIMLCSPVGAYVGGALDAVDVVIARNYDRAAPNGSGSFKVGGNYACSLYSLNVAHELGYKAVLYLDPATRKYIDEFNSSNFFAIKGNTYITPKSPSILPSITNMSLETVAAHLGMEVERRPVPVEELSTFEEVGECGTAVVITPVHKLVDKPFLESEEETVYTYGDGQCGPKSLKLYNYIKGIQRGEIEDVFGWNVFVD